MVNITSGELNLGVVRESTRIGFVRTTRRRFVGEIMVILIKAESVAQIRSQWLMATDGWGS